MRLFFGCGFALWIFSVGCDTKGDKVVGKIEMVRDMEDGEGKAAGESTATKIAFMYSLSGNCAASVPISMYVHVSVSDLYIPRIGPQYKIHIFSCSRIGRSIMGIYKSLTDT